MLVCDVRSSSAILVRYDTTGALGLAEREQPTNGDRNALKSSGRSPVTPSCWLAAESRLHSADAKSARCQHLDSCKRLLHVGVFRGLRASNSSKACVECLAKCMWWGPGHRIFVMPPLPRRFVLAAQCRSRGGVELSCFTGPVLFIVRG